MDVYGPRLIATFGWLWMAITIADVYPASLSGPNSSPRAPMDFRALPPQCPRDIGPCRAGPHIRFRKRWERPFHHPQPGCCNSPEVILSVGGPRPFGRRRLERLYNVHRRPGPTRQFWRSCWRARQPPRLGVVCWRIRPSHRLFDRSFRAPCPERRGLRVSSVCGYSGRPVC